jgi:septum site-determining protein MinD
LKQLFLFMQVTAHLRPVPHRSTQQQQVSHRQRLPPPCFTEAEDVNGEVTENRVIVVTSGKGGVGKTTTSANLGMSIAR